MMYQQMATLLGENLIIATIVALTILGIDLAFRWKGFKTTNPEWPIGKTFFQGLFSLSFDLFVIMMASRVFTDPRHAQEWASLAWFCMLLTAMVRAFVWIFTEERSRRV